MSDAAGIKPTQDTSATRRRLIQAAAWLSFAPAAVMLAWDLLQYLVPPRRRASLRKVFVARTPDLPAEDVREMAPYVLHHRIICEEDSGMTPEEALRLVLERVPVPEISQSLIYA